jgi:hypothetical protein
VERLFSPGTPHCGVVTLGMMVGRLQIAQTADHRVQAVGDAFGGEAQVFYLEAKGLGR